MSQKQTGETLWRLPSLRHAPWRVAIHALFFLSGATGLVFEVLWLRGLGLLFGNTAYAAAATLSLFFLGLAAGARVWGARAERHPNPLRAYALLECGVAITALFYVGLLQVYHLAYATMVATLGYGTLLRTAKLLLAATALVPPAFFMGGTLPLLAEHLVRGPHQLGRTGSLLYAVNTVGAALGALLAGFWLPRAFGFALSYGGAIGVTLLVGGAAFALSTGAPAREPAVSAVAAPAPSLAPDGDTGAIPLGMRAILGIAFLSGFATLGLEVLWTRLLAQVLNNSVHAFAAILVTFLAALGGGGLLAHRLARVRAAPRAVLAVLTGLAGVGVVLTTLLLVRATHGLSYLATDGGPGSYVRAIFTAAALLILVPGTLMGAILPLLFRATQRWRSSPGLALGRLASANSLGAILGSLTAGFLLLDMLGLWWSIVGMAAIYAGIASFALVGASARTPMRLVVVALPLSLAILAAGALQIPTVRLRRGEQIEWLREGSGGTVSVVRDGDNLVMRMNNHYVLGDSRSLAAERLQGHLPLLLHPTPRDVFFLGLGTGIMAGAALDLPVQRVVAAELVPEVVAASRARFQPYTSGLFRDPRVRIVVEDGRSYLAGSRDRYDVIIGDLFTPWHAGTGSLYTMEHFRTVRTRLRPGGIFAQWLPLHQLSETELMIIARTLRQVFPQVTLWRGDFSPSRPIVALVARREDFPLEDATLARNAALVSSATARSTSGTTTATGQHMAGLFYAGDLGWAGASEEYPLNTDDRPTIEYRFQRADFDPAARLTGATLARFYERLHGRVPPASDPVLSRLPAAEIRYVAAGLAFYKYHLYTEAGRSDSAAFFLRQFLAVVPTSPAPTPRADP